MLARSSWRAAPAVRRLARLGGLSDMETRLLVQSAPRLEIHEAGAEIGRGRGPKPPQVIAAGWAARTRSWPDGRQQIVGLLLPGDVFHLTPAETLAGCSVHALVRVDTVNASELGRALPEEVSRRRLAHALAAAQQVEHLLTIEQIVRLGRLTAYERTAHMVLELRDRLLAAGLADERRFLLPLKQEVLAEILGLSTIHMNRTLRQLQQDGMLKLEKRTVMLLEPEKLAALSGYRCVQTLALQAAAQAAPPLMVEFVRGEAASWAEPVPTPPGGRLPVLTAGRA